MERQGNAKDAKIVGMYAEIWLANGEKKITKPFRHEAFMGRQWSKYSAYPYSVTFRELNYNRIS